MSTRARICPFKGVEILLELLLAGKSVCHGRYRDHPRHRRNGALADSVGQIRGSRSGCAKAALRTAGSVVKRYLSEYLQKTRTPAQVTSLTHRGNVLSPLGMIVISVLGRLAGMGEGYELLLKLDGYDLLQILLLTSVVVQHSRFDDKAQSLHRGFEIGKVSLICQSAVGIIIAANTGIKQARLPKVESLVIYRIQILERGGNVVAQPLCYFGVIFLAERLLLGELELAQREHLGAHEAVGKPEFGNALGAHVIRDKALHRQALHALGAPPDSHRAVLLHNHEALGILVAAFRSRGVEFRPCGGGDGTVGFSEDQLVVKAGVCIGIEAQHIAEFPIIRIAHLDHVVPTGGVYDRVAFISVLRRRRRRGRNDQAGAKHGAKSRAY